MLAKTRTLSQREFRELIRSSNQSGVPSVQFIRPHNQPLGSWQARLKLPNGKTLTKAFSVKKYGERGAFEQATQARAALLDQIDNTFS